MVFNKYGPLFIEFVIEISKELIFALNICLIIVSLSSVPILNIPSSSSFTFISLCKNLPYKDSLDTKISLSPSFDNFFALR